jgi:hypothetical protein
MPLPRLVWPIPALLSWALAWAAYQALRSAGLSPALALLAASVVGVAMSFLGSSWWRRLIIAAGFPLALLVSGSAVLPPWAWLVPLVLLVLVYPLHAWRDAPLFPTPAHALRSLAGHAPLPPGALVLDAGCGLGHGLAALHEAYPAAQLHGIEWSWPLRLLCALRCPWARVRQGDIWRADWGPYGLVYLFQRPESMPRALAKAMAQMRPGSWLVSLEFEAHDWQATEVIRLPDGRPVWLYQAPFSRLTASTAKAANHSRK